MRSAILVVASIALAGPAHGADEIHWTIMGQTAVTFDWRGSETLLEYGTSSGAYTATATGVAPNPLPDSSPGPFQEAAITGLAENTLYYYRIGSGPERTFRTPPPRGSSDFWFAVEADVGSSLSYPAVAPTQAQIAADEVNVPGDDRPRFVLVPGDLSYGDQDGITRTDAHFNDVQVWSQDAAYMPAWGNHEWECNLVTCTVKVDNLNNYEGRFALPNTQSVNGASAAVGNGPADDWGWFDYGNVRFISMPSIDMTGVRSEWQTAAGPIMSAAQSDPLITFIVVYGHFPAWSSGADNGGFAALQTTFTTLHSSYPKFMLAFQGHSHHYERGIPSSTGGILNIVTGGGGSACGGLVATQPAWSYYRLNHFHHLKLHVSSSRIECFAVCGPAGGSGCTDPCTQDGLIDSWSLDASGNVVGVDPPGVMPGGAPVGRDGAIYDITGRRVVGPLNKGVYFERRGSVTRVVIVRS